MKFSATDGIVPSSFSKTERRHVVQAGMIVHMSYGMIIEYTKSVFDTTDK